MSNTPGRAALTITLAGSGNFLLVGAAQDYVGGSQPGTADRFRIRSVTVVPETSIWVLLGLGLMVIAARRLGRMS